MARRPTVISLYSGAGGLDYGFEAAGFDTRVTVEMDSQCCTTLRQNRRWAVIEGDIHDASSEQILEAGQLEVGEADVLIGGPPCQPFSKSSYWARDTLRLDDPRASTLAEYMRVVDGTLPAAFLLENVEGLNYSGKNEAFDLLVRFLDDINRRRGTRYQPHCAVLAAADYGVPQLRNRFFMIGSRDGLDFDFPAPTHAPLDVKGAHTTEVTEQLTLTELPRHRTAWHALADLDEAPDDALQMGGKWARLLPSIPEGCNYLWHTERGGGMPLFGWRRHYWSFLLKLARDRPSWTLQANPGSAIGPFHWDNRRLSSRELCRLQTFPDDVEITGNYRAIHRQLGNAVPSLLAEVLAREIRVQILGRRAPKGPPRLSPPNDAPAPPPKAPAPVPKEYLHLVGEHSAHPGTGKGYGAVARRRGEAEAENLAP